MSHNKLLPISTNMQEKTKKLGHTFSSSHSLSPRPSITKNIIEWFPWAQIAVLKRLRPFFPLSSVNGSLFHSRWLLTIHDQPLLRQVPAWELDRCKHFNIIRLKFDLIAYLVGIWDLVWLYCMSSMCSLQLTGKSLAAVARSSRAWLCVCGLSDDLIHWTTNSTSNWPSAIRSTMKEAKRSNKCHHKSSKSKVYNVCAL